MVAAKLRLLNNQTTRSSAKEAGVAQAAIAMAAVVLEYAPKLADPSCRMVDAAIARHSSPERRQNQGIAEARAVFPLTRVDFKPSLVRWARPKKIFFANASGVSGRLRGGSLDERRISIMASSYPWWRSSREARTCER